MTALHELSAREQADAVRRLEVSPVELVDHYLDRIAQLNPTLGAFITITGEAARRDAKVAAHEAVAGGRLPPLHGVPIAFTDLNLTAGVRTTYGSAVFTDLIPELSDGVVTRLRRAGTISLGKTNTPEFGLACYTEANVGPATRCPWDLGRSAGGASSGSAIAVAGGLLPFAQGTDGGGSIRTAASINGVFGLKPSRGLISGGPVRVDVSGQSTDGPIARTVLDAAAMLDAMAGPIPGDLFAAPGIPDGESYIERAQREPGRLRIGRYSTPVASGVEIHPEVMAAWEDASALLASLGHAIEDVEAPFGPELVPAIEAIWAAAASTYPVESARADRLLPLTRYLRQHADTISAREYLRIRARLQVAAWQDSTRLAFYDVLLAPTLSMPPRPLRWFQEDGPGAADFERQKRFAAYTTVYNFTGHPAVSVPLYWTVGAEPGLPIGSMLIGRHGADGLLLSLAAQLEAARPWAGRHPALW